jgi:hypothetical protein
MRAFAQKEPRFGHDFTRGRVHSDAAAEQSARGANARPKCAGVVAQGQDVGGMLVNILRSSVP